METDIIQTTDFLVGGSLVKGMIEYNEKYPHAGLCNNKVGKLEQVHLFQAIENQIQEKWEKELWSCKEEILALNQTLEVKINEVNFNILWLWKE